MNSAIINTAHINSARINSVMVNGVGIPSPLSSRSNTLPPDLLAKIAGLWIFDQNTNDSPIRNIIKNNIPGAGGGDLEILNAAYKLNSGYGLYKEDFTSWSKQTNVVTTANVVTVNPIFKGLWLTYKRSNVDTISSTTVKITGIPDKGLLWYMYCGSDNSTVQSNISITKDGTYLLPASVISINAHSIGFYIGEYSSLDWTNIRIEQIPDHQGAFVTDGVDDIIISQKPVSEMLEGSNKITVLSMIHQIDTPNTYTSTNAVRNNDNTVYSRNMVNKNSGIGKTGIYGYTAKNSIVTKINLLGDKEDYTVSGNQDISNLSSPFYVEGWVNPAGTLRELSSIACYWSMIAKDVLTSDEINQIIAYYNLDKYVQPVILLDNARQGMTNENHSSFGDKLIDYSGNGRDMQLYNMGWKESSGIKDNAVVFDGIDDYGLVDNTPILKDYTLAIERWWITPPINKNQALVSKGPADGWGAYAFELSENKTSTYSFQSASVLNGYSEKSLVYQSKYIYNGTGINAGSISDGSILRLGRNRNSYPYYANAAIKTFILFPYSLSEFLLERQLKKYKLGTLYPAPLKL